MVCIDVIKSPLREREGAASSPAGHVPSDSEGRERTGASGGGGGARDVGFARGFVLVILPPPGAGGGSEQSGRARPERQRGS